LFDKKRDKRGAARDKTGTARDKTGTARDKTGTTRDKTGTVGDKKGQGHNWTNAQKSIYFKAQIVPKLKW
jgi:hypothetical protein